MQQVLPIVNIGGNELLPLAEAWEQSVIECWKKGVRIPTQYDQGSDPNSRDVSLRMAIDPNGEPLFHRALPGGFYDNEIYVAEVVEGVHDYWIKPEEGKWQYTYHERMENYKVPGLEEPVNQLDYVVNGLAEAPHGRRIQITTWKPWEDAGISDPACLQRMWFRIFNHNGKSAQLVMNCYMRSNDAFKAAWKNIYAFMEIGFLVARRLSERLGAEIVFAQYQHSADSYHIYGSYFDEFENFLDTTKTRTFEQRTWTREEARPYIIDVRSQVLDKLNKELNELSGKTAQDLAERIDRVKDRYHSDPYYPMEVQ